MEIPLFAKISFTAILLCMHFQKNIWILGKVLSFQIQETSKDSASIRFEAI